MIYRKLEAPDRSFFLFGPRQTGKSTWLNQLGLPDAWMVNLLHNDTYFRYLRDPAQFRREAQAKIANGTRWIILDEVQRIPALLDEVHGLIESGPVRFILSGSSARKLKRGGGNLLGGRAVMRHLHPFTVQELGSGFELDRALQWGTLPPLLGLSDRDARDSLRAYVEIYLREEIQQEGLVRNLGGFTRFLDLAGAYCGEILNFSSLAKEAGLPIKTVQSYFQVLEDTLIVLRLPAWAKSPLKRLVCHPKFYLFDNGVTNALAHRLSAPIDAATRGRLFEQFMVQETRRRLDYAGADTRLYFWRTNNGAEVDLLVELNGSLTLAVEFKSRPQVSGADLSGLRALREDHPTLPCLLVTTSPEPFDLDFAQVLPWAIYLARIDAMAAGQEPSP
jgi:predicted AAA+ superfamily ATPase